MAEASYRVLVNRIKDKLGHLQQDILTTMNYDLNDNLTYQDIIQYIISFEQNGLQVKNNNNINNSKNQPILLNDKHQDLPLQFNKYQNRLNQGNGNQANGKSSYHNIDIDNSLSDQVILEDSQISDVEDFQFLQEHKKVLEDYKVSIQELKKQNLMIKQFVQDQQLQTQLPYTNQQRYPQQEYKKNYSENQLNVSQNAQFSIDTAKFNRDYDNIMKRSESTQLKSIENYDQFLKSLHKRREQNFNKLKNIEQEINYKHKASRNKKPQDYTSQSFRKSKKNNLNNNNYYANQSMQDDQDYKHTSDKKQQKLHFEIENLDSEIQVITEHIQKIVNEDEE